MLEALTISLGLSLHAGFEGDYNEIHPHVRYQQEQFMAGYYYNSLSNHSMYAGYRYETDNNLGFELALVTGYEQPVVPLLRATYDYDNVRFFLHPGMEQQDMGLVVGLELSLK
jgi:hypothetical protein